MENERLWAVLCYVPVFNLLFCTLASVRMHVSQLCRFHARQGYILFLFWVLATLISVFSGTLGMMSYGVVFVLHAYAGVIAYKGQEIKIPLVWDFAEKIPEFYVYKFLTGKEPIQNQSPNGTKK